MSESRERRSRHRRRSSSSAPDSGRPLSDRPWRPSSRDRGSRARRPKRRSRTPRWLRRLRKRFNRFERRLALKPSGRFRWRFLRRTLIAVALLAAAAYGWRQFWLHRSAGEMLAGARRQLDRGEPLQAANQFDAYLRLFPQDLGVRVERARAYGSQAKTAVEKQRALELYQLALAAKQDLAEVHCRMAQLEFDLGRDDKAVLHADAALAEDAEQAVAWKYKGLAETRQFVRGERTDEVAPLEALRRAAELLPGDVEVVSTFSGAMRREGLRLSTPVMVAEADAALDRLIGLDPANPEVWLTRYAYRMTFGLPDAAGDLDEALFHSPYELEVVLASARSARRAGSATLAESLFDKAVELAPESGRAHLGRALVKYEAGQRDEAIGLARKALGPTRHDPWLTAQLCEWLVASRQFEEAESLLTGLTLQLADSESGLPPPQREGLEITAAFIRARSLIGRNRHLEAVETLKPLVVRVQKLDQDEFAQERALQVHYSLAECYANLDDWAAAADQFDAAAKLQPQVAAHHVRAAQAWERGLRPDYALRRFELALQVDPSSVEIAQHIRRLNAALTGAHGGDANE